MGKSKSNNKKRKSSSSSDQCNQSSPNVCALCEKYSSSSDSSIGSNKRNRTFHSVQDFWFHGTSMKQKLSLLQVDKGFVLKQIRSSNLYNPNFSLKKSTTLSSSLSSSSSSTMSTRPTTTTVSSSVSTANSVNASNNDNSSTTSSSTVDALASSSMHANQQRMAASSTQPTISAPVLATPANVSSHHHHHQHSNNSTSVVISSSLSQPSTALSQLQQQQSMNSPSHHHGSVLSNNTNSVANNNATTTNMNNSGSSGSVNTNIPNVNNNTQPNKMMLPKSISGRKPLFGGKETCLCPACKKRKAIFNVVVKVFEDYIEELECKSCGKAMPVRPSPQIQSISLGSISTSLSSRMPGVNQLPFGDCLIIKNDKLTVSEAYLKDGGAHFYDIMKKCSEIFPDDLKLQPHQSPPPENIHMLINYCTMNSELNIKNIMLKAKKNALMNEIHSSDESSDEELSGSEDGDDDDEDDEDEGDDEDDDEYTSDSDADSDESTSDGYISGEECDEVLPKDDSININGIVRSNTQESRLLFQIYLARIFAHNVNVAFRDIVALQAQRELLEECEIDEKMKSNKQSKNTKKQSKQKKSKQKKVPASAAAKTTSKITPTKQEREAIPPLDILKEASSVIMSEEMVEDEWNVVQAKAKVQKQSKYSPQDECSPRDESVLQSLEPPSRSVSPTLSTASTISAVSTNSSTSGTNTSQKKKKKNRASNEVTKQINFDTKSPIKEEPSFTEQFKAFTDVRLNDSLFFEDIDSMLNDSYMTPRSNDYGNYSIPPIGYELRSSNDAHNDQHLVQNSFSPFTLPTFFPLVNRL